MDVEQYQGLLRLVSGVSLFVISLLVFRLLSLRSKRFGGTGVGGAGDEVGDDGSGWHGIEELTVVDVVQETSNIKSLYLRRSEGRVFPRFRAGQFLSLQIGSDAKAIRSYSISSSENSRQTLQISVRRIEGGVGSEWVHGLRAGSKVLAYPPSGHFVDVGAAGSIGADVAESPQARQRVYVAGGIGITPLLSMILTNLENSSSFPMVLFYGVRTQADLAYHGLFEYFAKRHSRFQYFPVLSHDADWKGDRGFLTFDFVAGKLAKIGSEGTAATGLGGNLFFICGPEPMSEPLMSALFNKGVPEESILNEKFISSASLDLQSIPERKVTVEWAGKRLNYSGRMSLLEFLESQGEYVPFACRTGVCGTCKCHVEGKVKALSQSGLTLSERRRGLVLSCVAFPEGDVKVDLV